MSSWLWNSKQLKRDVEWNICWLLLKKCTLMVQWHYIHMHVCIGNIARLLLCALLKVVGASRDTIGENYG